MSSRVQRLDAMSNDNGIDEEAIGFAVFTLLTVGAIVGFLAFVFLG